MHKSRGQSGNIYEGEETQTFGTHDPSLGFVGEHPRVQMCSVALNTNNDVYTKGTLRTSLLTWVLQKAVVGIMIKATKYVRVRRQDEDL